MKKILVGVLLLLSYLCNAKYATAVKNPYAKIDQYAASIGYYPADTLSIILTRPYKTDSEKVRSILYWITQHIAYDVKKFHSANLNDPNAITYESDSIKAEEYYTRFYGESTIKRKMGVCEDYARLMKLLCSKANIECRVIHGNAKTTLEDIGKPYNENHAWNAIKIAGKWKLIDPCWASGSCNSAVTKYTKKFDECYYCSPPEIFALNHYPADSIWLLTKTPISQASFLSSPLTFSLNPHFKEMKQNLTGELNMKIGETVSLVVEIDGLDTFNLPYTSFLMEYDAKGKLVTPNTLIKKNQTCRKEGNKIFYDLKICNNKTKSIYVAYNNKYLMAYRVNVKNK